MLDAVKQYRREIDQARAFAEQYLAPRRGGLAFDRAAWEACVNAGYLRCSLPTAWQRESPSMLHAVCLQEALGRGGADRGLLFSMGAHLFACCPAIARHGRPAISQRYADGAATGRLIAALAVTEPHGGTSLATMQTVAEETPNGYVLNGVKTLITNAPVADVFLIVAANGTDNRRTGLSCFLVPRSSAGLSVLPLESTLGMHGAPMGQVSLDGCRLSSDDLLGDAGRGAMVLLECLQSERACILAGLLGAAERDLSACVEFVASRGPKMDLIRQRQSVAHRLARVRCRLEVSRLMLYRAASAVDADDDPFVTSAMAKLTISENLVESALDVLRVFAGPGWLDEQGVGTALRDVVGTLSASGTSDVLLNAIAADTID